MDNYGLGLVGAALDGGFLLSPLVVDTVEQTGLRLRAIYDRDPFDAKEASLVIESKYDQVDIPQDIYQTQDLHHLFDDFMLDLMLVAVPAAERRALVEAAYAGFDRLALLSPIALTLEDAAAIAAASRKKPLLMNFPRRFEAGWQKAYVLLQSGMIGELQFINLRAFLPETNYLRLWQRTQTGRDDLFLGQLCNYMDTFNWFAGAACLQLSAMGELGVHDLDDYDPYGSFQALFKRLPISWRSLVSAHTDGVDVDDFPADEYIDRMSVQLRFSNDVLATLTVASSGPAAHDAEDLELVGDKGRIWFNAADGTLFVHFWDGSPSERLDNLGDIHLPLADRLNAAFLAQMPGYILGIVPAATAVHGMEALKLALAALDSIQNNGAAVLMDLQLAEEPLAEVEPAEGVLPESELGMKQAEQPVEPAQETTAFVALQTDSGWEEDHPAVEIIGEALEDAPAVEETTAFDMVDWPEPLTAEDDDALPADEDDADR